MRLSLPLAAALALAAPLARLTAGPTPEDRSGGGGARE